MSKSREKIKVAIAANPSATIEVKEPAAKRAPPKPPIKADGNFEKLDAIRIKLGMNWKGYSWALGYASDGGVSPHMEKAGVKNTLVLAAEGLLARHRPNGEARHLLLTIMGNGDIVSRQCFPEETLIAGKRYLMIEI